MSMTGTLKKHIGRHINYVLRQYAYELQLY